MSYESKIIIVDAHRQDYELSQNYGKVYHAEKVAELNMSSMMGYKGFRELFNKEIDFKIFVEDGDHETMRDRYGEVMTECDLKAAIAWLENAVQEPDDYHNNRRPKMLLGLLKSLNPQDWVELHIVHYGY